MNKEVDRRQKHIDELYELIQKTNDQKKVVEEQLSAVETRTKVAEAELKAIKKSRSYAAAQKLSKIKRKVTRG
jgi:Mg2+/Co2+ transporter CorC